MMNMAVEEWGSLAGSRVSRSEAVAHQVADEIARRRLGPGDRLGTKEDLRQRFGGAVATINGAIRLLEMRRYVEARPGPGGGIFVAPSSARVRIGNFVVGFRWESASFADCMDVRSALEPLVCREAARHRGPNDVRALGRILDRMEERSDAPRERLRMDWALHRRIAKLCPNAPLRSFYLLVLDSLEEALNRVEAVDVVDVDSIAAHRELVAAIARGDDEACLEAANRHIALTRED
jgi:DNA-binding FadR family transcriptional regulator